MVRRATSAVANVRAAGHTSGVKQVLRIGLASAFLLALLVASGCSATSRCPPGAPCPASLPRLTYVLTVNGHAVPLVKDGEAPRIRVRPGQHVLINVSVTLPSNLKITALWLGISSGPSGFSRKALPSGLNPILAHTRQALTGGPHAFTLQWRIPQHRRGPLLLMSDWSSPQPSQEVAGPIAWLARG